MAVARNLGIHRAPRSPLDAADEPLARPALDSLLDDRRHAHGRRVAVVRTGRDAADFRRAAAFRRSGRRGQRRASPALSSSRLLKKLSQRPRPCQLEPHCWSKVLPPDKFSFPSGHTMTAFSIAPGGELFLSVAGGPAVFPGPEHRGVSHRAGHAFPQRRAGRRGTGRGAGLRLDHRVRFFRLGLNQSAYSGLGCAARASRNAANCSCRPRRSGVHPGRQRTRGRVAPILELVNGVVVQIVQKFQP